MTNTNEPTLLGPFLGHVTTNSIKIWLHFEGAHRTVYVTLHPTTVDAPAAKSAKLELQADNLFTDCVTIEGLQPKTKYFYKLWTDPKNTKPFPLDGLEENELRFWTLSDDPNEQIDFVVMSCHNPTVSGADGYDGHAVWADIPQIIARDNNDKVRFALLVGDQIYADDWESLILEEKTEEARVRHYISAYRRFWSNIHYRRVMCSLPSVMMWDDHDITDGWGSRIVSFRDDSPTEFKENWRGLFEAARKAFAVMQASRNPAPLAIDPKEGFDSCFCVGKWGFVLLDLRTNRNLKLNRLHTDDQFARIKKWIEDNQSGMQTLFVVSPVVFSHGSPVIDDLTLKAWPYVLWLADKVASWGKWGKGLNTRFDKSLGDISDDIKDSWGSAENAEQADRILDLFFDLQNDGPNVVVLSGDIHTSGYANIYSNYQKHAGRSSITHITSSSVAYTPFNWILESIYRYASKTVALGKRGAYSSQISHHFCSRSLAVLSLRPTATKDDHELKVKFYLEGFPEPQVLLFDLKKITHSENITWHAQDKVSRKRYAPTAYLDVDALLALRAKDVSEQLNWKESAVDIMKLFGFDSSLEAREQLAVKWGFKGKLKGSPEMNIFLLEEIKKRIRESGGKIPEV